MRTCWLKFGKRASPQHWEVDATGYALIASDTECAGRRLPRMTGMDKGPQRRLRIGERLELSDIIMGHKRAWPET